MSVFTKRPDGSGGATPPGAQKPETQTTSPKTPPAQKQPVQAAPPVVVSRTIDVGGAQSKTRPSAPTVKVAPPAAAPAPTAPASGTTRVAAPSATSLFASHTRAAATTQKMETRPDPSAQKKESKPKSVRPTAPELMAVGLSPDSGPDSLAGTFEKLLGNEVDQSFDFVEKKGSAPPPATGGIAEADLAEVRSLFAQLASNHVRQVRDFMIDLRWGEATIEWISICSPALKSLRRAADKLELADLVTALDVFWQHLTNTQAKAGGRTIEGEPRDTILAAYEKLASVMPQAFALDMDRAQREAAILQSLLLQVPEVKKVTIDKLYAAGLTTLEAMLLATPGDIAATTGIEMMVAVNIVSRFRDYREQVVAGVPDATRAQERDRITKLTARLRMEHDAFVSASRGWSPEDQERKKTSREARSKTLLDIQVILARLGEVDRLKEIEKLPFEKKLAHLESFLEEARDKYVAQP